MLQGYSKLEILEYLNRKEASKKFNNFIISSNFKKCLANTGVYGDEFEKLLIIINLLKDLEDTETIFSILTLYILNAGEIKTLMKDCHRFSNLSRLKNTLKENKKSERFIAGILKMREKKIDFSYNNRETIIARIIFFSEILLDNFEDYKNEILNIKDFAIDENINFENFLLNSFVDIFLLRENMKIYNISEILEPEKWENSLIIINEEILNEDISNKKKNKIEARQNNIKILEKLIKKNYIVIEDTANINLYLEGILKSSNLIKLEDSENITKPDANIESLLFGEKDLNHEIKFEINKKITLSNSAIKDFLKNPYFFFIKRILGLKMQYENLEEDNAALKGKIIHKICEDFAMLCKDRTIEINNDNFLKSATQTLQDYEIHLKENLLWKYHIDSISDKILKIEKNARRNNLKVEVEPQNIIISNYYNIFNLKAIPDRIEYINNNIVEVYDFKTGINFNKNDEINGKNPQFAIMAIIFEHLGFKIRKASYIFLSKENKEDIILEEDYIEQIKENAKINIDIIMKKIENAQIEDFEYVENSNFQSYEEDKLMEYFARKKVAY